MSQIKWQLDFDRSTGEKFLKAVPLFAATRATVQREGVGEWVVMYTDQPGEMYRFGSMEQATDHVEMVMNSKMDDINQMQEFVNIRRHTRLEVNTATPESPISN